VRNLHQISFVMNGTFRNLKVFPWKAINTVIQGSAADMMKSAMVNMAENIKKSWKGPAITRPQML
jgi:DNA polymerase I-like protein with 3'-5' exonuclease and polymerase domains